VQGVRTAPRTAANGVPEPGARCSSLYGARIASHWALPFATPHARPGVPDITIHPHLPAHYLAEAERALEREPPRDPAYAQRRIAGGVYLRWTGLFDFVVTDDGADVYSRPLRDGAGESFHTYLFNQVLSFALLCRGREPLHSASVVVGGRAVGFLGDCGFGKSSLAAACMAAGHPLLTDEVAVVFYLVLGLSRAAASTSTRSSGPP